MSLGKIEGEVPDALLNQETVIGEIGDQKKWDEEHCMGLLITLVMLGKAGRPWNKILPHFREALNQNPEMKLAIGKAMRGISPIIYEVTGG